MIEDIGSGVLPHSERVIHDTVKELLYRRRQFCQD
jgi:hypothetical protein